MTVKIVPIHSQNEPYSHGIKFDVILEEGHVVTLEMDEYEIRAYRGAPLADIIENRVWIWLQSNDYDPETISIIFC